MNRLLVFALVASIGNASAAFAGESILSVGARHAEALAVADASAPAVPILGRTGGTAAVPSTRAQEKRAAYQGQGGTLSKSGMSKGKKALIYIGLAAVAVGGIMTIDKNVLDVTPSSLGTRQD